MNTPISTRREPTGESAAGKTAPAVGSDKNSETALATSQTVPSNARAVGGKPLTAEQHNKFKNGRW